MNTTRVKEKVEKILKKKRKMNQKFTGDSIQEDREYYAYLYRYSMNGEMKWKVETVWEDKQNIEYPEKKGHRQAAVKFRTAIITDRKIEIEELSIIEKSKIVKQKEEIKDILLQIYYIGWEDVYVLENHGMVGKLDDNNFTDCNIRPLEKDDFKVTTVWGRNKSMHLGHGSYDKDYLFRLGVNWEWWHRSDSTRRLKTLSHELAHCLFAHHKRSFFREHIRIVKNISQSEGRKNRIESLFENEIDWGQLFAKSLKGVHNQPKEIDITGYKHRKEACEGLVEELSAELGYNYDAGRLLYFSQPTDSMVVQGMFDDMKDDDSDYKSKEEYLDVPIKSINIEELTINESYSDGELYNYYKEKTEKLRHRNWFIYDEEDIPKVENGEVKTNHKFVLLHKKFSIGNRNSAKIPVIDQENNKESHKNREIEV